MDTETRRRLNALNHVFYQAVAAQFSDSRRHPWPGWERVLACLQRTRPDSGAGALSVLDVGCGNGRFAHFLADRRSAPLRYLGVDASPALLAIAHEETRGLNLAALDLQRLDVLDGQPGEHLPAGPFDLVVGFGLLHHIPGFATRRAVVRALLERLAPSGLVAVTAWRFGDSPRFAKRRVSWDSYNRDAAQPIDQSQLEDGDHLLAFGEPATSPRYCHHSSDEELQRLVTALPGRLVECFDADGREGDLNRYLVLTGEPVGAA